MGEISRVFSDDLGVVDDFHVKHHTLNEIFEHTASVLRRLALPERSQARR